MFHYKILMNIDTEKKLSDEQVDEINRILETIEGIDGILMNCSKKASGVLEEMKNRFKVFRSNPVFLQVVYLSGFSELK